MSNPEKDFLPPWKQHVADQAMRDAVTSIGNPKDPLSDEAMRKYGGSTITSDFIDAWQECARRARDSEEEWELTCESLAEDIKRLRELLEASLDDLEYWVPRDGGDGSLCLRIVKQRRAALEGKE